MSPNLQRVLHWSGSGLGLIGAAFVAWRLHGYWGNLDFSHFTGSTWVLMALIVSFYASANLLLAFAWRLLLLHQGAKVICLWSVKAYGISQLAKYVPGNIFHLAGRQALGMAAGVSGSALAKSTVWELGLMAIAGSVYGFLVLPLVFSGFALLNSTALFLGVACGGAYLFRKIISTQVAGAFCLQVLFLALSGAVFVALCQISVPGWEFGIRTSLLLEGAYIIAWLAGFVTPGAPAGMGVRELVLLFLAKGILAESDLLLVTLLGRVVTVAGDSVFFVFSTMGKAAARSVAA